MSEELSGRELDAAIAERVLGWKRCKVGPDYDGKNECEILTPDGKLPREIDLPRKGLIHPAYLVPCFHSDLSQAIRLAQRFGKKPITIEADIRELPTLISRMVLKEATEGETDRGGCKTCMQL